MIVYVLIIYFSGDFQDGGRSITTIDNIATMKSCMDAKRRIDRTEYVASTQCIAVVKVKP